MEKKKGRVPGRSLTELELRHLRLLHEFQTRTTDSSKALRAELEDFVLELLEGDDGTSEMAISSAIGVPKGTVHDWRVAARGRRES